MHPETYTRFYILIAAALLIGFVGMEVATTGSALGGSMSGMATYDITDASSLTGNGTPASNLIFMLIGMIAGAVIVGTALFIYQVERKRIV